jgi:hypothetical protein
MDSPTPVFADVTDEQISELNGLLGRPRERITATVIWPEDAVQDQLEDQRIIDARHDMLAALHEISGLMTWNECTQSAPQIRQTKAEISNALDRCIGLARAAVAKAKSRSS